jgi:hypothetical protein
MFKTNDGRIKLLGGAWLVGGGLFLAIALFAIAQFIISPSADEGGFWGGAIFVLVLLVVGAIYSVNGLALWRRNMEARPFLAVSSLVLLVPSAVGAVGGIGIPAFLIVVASLWLTLSKGGKEAYQSYMARVAG